MKLLIPIFIIVLVMLFTNFTYGKTSNKQTAVVEAIESYWMDPKYGRLILNLRKINGVGYINHSINLNQDWPGIPFLVSVKTYRWSDNQFKTTGIVFKRNICDFLKYESRMFFPLSDPMFDHFRFTCPLKKGFYYIKNFPANLIVAKGLPDWKIKVFQQILHDDYVFLNASIIVNIEEIIQYQ